MRERIRIHRGTLIQTLFPFQLHSIWMLQKRTLDDLFNSIYISADYKIGFEYFEIRACGALLCNFHRRYLIPITTLLFSNRRPFTLATIRTPAIASISSIRNVCVRLKVVSKHITTPFIACNSNFLSFIQFQWNSVASNVAINLHQCH